MEIGIIGLPKSGKTTVFNALSKGKAETSSYAAAVLAPNIGVVKVPDSRLHVLAEISKPQRTVPAEVKYIDVALPSQDFGKREGISGQFLAYLSKVDAIVHVVRVFQDESVPHVEGGVNPERDISTMDLELAFSDMAIIERKLQRIASQQKGAKPQEREALLKEKALLERVKSDLEKEVPLRDQHFADQEARLLENYQFLTAKPLLLALNIGEGQLSQTTELEERFSGYRKQHCEVAVICGKLEMELVQLSDADAQDFRANLGLKEAGLDRMIRLSYGLLGLISFFTIGPDEVRAWTIRRGTSAVRAAGKIHSDLERGFIRAEVVSYGDLASCGSLAESKKRGLLRLEGKDYIVQDGDVMTVLFNV